jgi:hypothetical protein
MNAEIFREQQTATAAATDQQSTGTIKQRRLSTHEMGRFKEAQIVKFGLTKMTQLNKQNMLDTINSQKESVTRLSAPLSRRMRCKWQDAMQTLSPSRQQQQQ